MFKVILILGSLFVLFIAETACQRPHIIYPTYRPPPSRPVIIRTAREAGEPQWLFKGDDIPRAPTSGDHPFLPSYIDDIKLDPNRRTARSLSTPRASRGGGTRQSSSRDTGPTHPGYNRRNARDIRVPLTLGSFDTDRSGRHLPSWYPTFDRERIPIYVRDRRDISQEELARQEHLEQVASQEQLRTKRSIETLTSQEQLGQLASQEQLRTKRGIETLASQEQLGQFASQEQLGQLASQEQLRTKRGVETLASQEQLGQLASREQLGE